MDILKAIKARFSTRAFLSDQVPESVIESILEVARFAPSGKNTQPCHVAIVTGKTQQAIAEALLQAFHAGDLPQPGYQYYPKELPPHIEKRIQACGAALYKALGVDYHDKIKRAEQWAQNYRFFGAPVCLLIFIDKIATEGTFMDAGMFMQNIMLAALDFKLATCPQASLAAYPDLVKGILGAPFEDKVLLAGISLGYPDVDHPVNQYRTEREAVSSIAKWYE